MPCSITHIDKKLEAVFAYKTQFHQRDSSEPITPISTTNFKDSISYRAQDLGRLIGTTHEEGFNTERYIAVENLDKFYKLHTEHDHVNINITHTVSVWNFFYLREFHHYFETVYPEFLIWNNLVHFPEWCEANVVPGETKKLIIDIVGSMNTNDYAEEPANAAETQATAEQQPADAALAADATAAAPEAAPATETV